MSQCGTDLPLFCPGMTDANMHLVTVDVQLPAGELAAPKPKLEAGEHIVQKLVEVSQLWETLQGSSRSPSSSFLFTHSCSSRFSPLCSGHVEYESRGFVIDARLGHLVRSFLSTRPLPLLLPSPPPLNLYTLLSSLSGLRPPHRQAAFHLYHFRCYRSVRRGDPRGRIYRKEPGRGREERRDGRDHRGGSEDAGFVGPNFFARSMQCGRVMKS